MKLIFVLLMISSSFGADIKEGEITNMKWLTVNFSGYEKEVTLEGKVSVEKDCNEFSIDEKINKLSEEKYILELNKWTTTKGCPNSKKTKINHSLKKLTFKRPKNRSLMILVPVDVTLKLSN